MSIATRKGDKGTTRLICGDRVSKGSLRIDAFGSVDELGSFLGLARYHAAGDEVANHIEMLQRSLFILASELATPPEERHRLKKTIDDELLKMLDDQVSEIESREGILSDWALPGATAVGAYLDVARTVCRRVERSIVRLIDAGEEHAGLSLQFVNRLGDLIWLYARWYEVRHGVDGALRHSHKDHAVS